MAIEQHREYLFVFAHPDDELYLAGLMHRLLRAGKKVVAAYITSGDAGANPVGREAELAKAVQLIGVAPQDVHLLRFPEVAVLDDLPNILRALGGLASAGNFDCIVGMEYEGGHVAHDAASLVTAKTAEALDVPYYTFPVYHIRDGQRRAAEFSPGRQATDIIHLTAEEAGVKDGVLAAHAGQADHFQRLQAADPGYLGRLRGREVYRRIDPTEITFSEPAAAELGYARSEVSYEDFARAVASLSV